MRFRKEAPINVMPDSGPSAWEVVVVPASEAIESDYYYGRGDRYHRIAVEGEIAVRLRLNGKDRMTYGVAKIADADFEDKITTLKAEAEDKAATLNAVGAGA